MALLCVLLLVAACAQEDAGVIRQTKVPLPIVIELEQEGDPDENGLLPVELVVTSALPARNAVMRLEARQGVAIPQGEERHDLGDLLPGMPLRIELTLTVSEPVAVLIARVAGRGEEGVVQGVDLLRCGQQEALEEERKRLEKGRPAVLRDKRGRVLAPPPAEEEEAL